MKFVMSYSCGKDSTLALHKMIENGHQPVCLLVMQNKNAGRSYFHGADPALLKQYEQALNIPLLTCPSCGPDYAAVFTAGLKQAKARGAEAAAFGDIDIDENRRWEEERCAEAGLQPCLPLWQRGQAENVQELLDLGYKCLIKSVNSKILPANLPGKYLNRQTIEIMRAAGADVCGENGEYHTLVVDGPIFAQPLKFELGQILQFGNHAAIEIK